MFKGIDLYSDTLTKPTPGMRKAISEAEVGDEQRQEDPTTLKLQERMAELLGFESSLFLPCATMANEIALQLHCNKGEEVFAADNAHIFFAEAGGPGGHAGVLARPIMTETGLFTPEDLYYRVNPNPPPLCPVPRLIVVENTSNNGGGRPWPQSHLRSILSFAAEMGLKTHLDGARLFNASVATSTPVKELAQGFDSVTICFSKGLGCPTGSILTFHKRDYAKALRLKHYMGGAMRQSGILSAAVHYALDHHIERLAEDHQNATTLAKGLSSVSPHLKVENKDPASNMIFARWNHPSVSCEGFISACEAKGVRFSQVGANRVRAVTHLDISSSDIDKALNLTREVCSQWD